MDRIQIKVKRPRPTPSQSPAIRRSQPGPPDRTGEDVHPCRWHAGRWTATRSIRRKGLRRQRAAAHAV